MSDRPAAPEPEVARFAPPADEAALDAPAGAYLDALPWAGPPPDPDDVDAATFLARL
jgi:hypothetical protein